MIWHKVQKVTANLNKLVNVQIAEDGEYVFLITEGGKSNYNISKIGNKDYKEYNIAISEKYGQGNMAVFHDPQKEVLQLMGTLKEEYKYAVGHYSCQLNLKSGELSKIKIRPYSNEEVTALGLDFTKAHRAVMSMQKLSNGNYQIFTHRLNDIDRYVILTFNKDGDLLNELNINYGARIYMKGKSGRYFTNGEFSYFITNAKGRNDDFKKFDQSINVFSVLTIYCKIDGQGEIVEEGIFLRNDKMKVDFRDFIIIQDDNLLIFGGEVKRVKIDDLDRMEPVKAMRFGSVKLE